MQLPIVLLAFNRPETTRRVFEEIRKARPSQLLIVADGPRITHPTDRTLCNEVRQICQNVDWACDLHLRYLDENLGCRRSVLEGLDWVFEQVERAIILEDDCLPNESFFPFCEELLDRYANDDRIGMISGDNFQFGGHSVPESYYFSRHCHIWGWATWRRAWMKRDPVLREWTDLKKTDWLEKIVGNGPQLHYWATYFDDAQLGTAGGLGTWDVAWTFSCWLHGMCCILPHVNLVKNIGFGEGATHTQVGGGLENMSAESLEFPLTHPGEIRQFAAADDFTERRQYYGVSFLQRIFWTLRLPISLRTLIKLKEMLD